MLNPQLNSYNYPDHVLFQFIVASFLQSHRTALKLKTIILQIEPSLSKCSAPCEHRSKLFCVAEELAGRTSPYHSHFSWSPSPGTLNSLKNNCILFERAFAQDFPEALQIKKHAVKSWLYSGEMRDLAFELLKESSSASDISFARFQKIETLMTRTLKIFGTGLTKMIPRFKENENVLFSLLKQQNELDAFYGIAYTRNIFKKMFRSSSSAHKFLIEAYRQREFIELLPDITRYIDSLDRTS